MWQMNCHAKRIGLLLGPALFLVVRCCSRPDGLTAEAQAVLATTIWMAIWWITESIPIAVTALLPIVLFPLTGALSVQETSTQYGHRYIFLYVGGFLLALAIEKWALHRRIALHIIVAIGSSVAYILLGFMVATAWLSMWISNTATAVMMLPIGMAVVSQLRNNPCTDKNETEVFGKALMLSIAYSASIGGMATLVGTPPNLVLAGVVQETYGIEIGFGQWMRFGLPVSIVLLVICWLYLTRIAFSLDHAEFPGGVEEIRRQLRELDSLSSAEWRVLVVFVLTALAWICRSFVQKQLGWLPRLDDTIIAMISGLSLFVIPNGMSGIDRDEERNRVLLDWEDTKELPWGIVFLFGGGMALAEGFQSSGLAQWVGSKASMLDGFSLLMIVCVLIAVVNFLTEVTSNLATTSMLLPILASMAESINVHPLLLMVGATVAASCAFMLPVATPPNAVVFGSRYLHIPDMVRAGLGMNLISIVGLTVVVYFLLPILWGVDLTSFPQAWR